MKILVPSDFSKIADDAFHAACLIAQKWNAEIHLFHAADMPQEWDKLPLTDQLRSQIGTTILNNTKNQFAIREKKAQEMNLKAFFHYAEGRFLDNIRDLTTKTKFDLLVIGSHGASGKKEWFLGSNAQKAIRHLHQSILVIKNPIEEVNFSSVLFASGLLEEDQKAFKQLLEFIKIGTVKEIHILAIETGALFNPPKIVMLEALKDFKALAKEYDCTTHFHKNLSIEAGIRKFTTSENIELVALSNHIKHPLKRIFTGSNVEMVVNHSEVPVLSIDY